MANAEHHFSHNFKPFLDANPDAKSKSEITSTGGVRESGLIAFYLPQMNSLGKTFGKPVLLRVFFDSQNVSFGLNRKRNMYVISELGQVKVIRVKRCCRHNLKRFCTLDRT